MIEPTTRPSNAPSRVADHTIPPHYPRRRSPTASSPRVPLTSRCALQIGLESVLQGPYLPEPRVFRYFAASSLLRSRIARAIVGASSTASEAFRTPRNSRASRPRSASTRSRIFSPFGHSHSRVCVLSRRGCRAVRCRQGSKRVWHPRVRSLPSFGSDRGRERAGAPRSKLVSHASGSSVVEMMVAIRWVVAPVRYPSSATTRYLCRPTSHPGPSWLRTRGE